MLMEHSSFYMLLVVGEERKGEGEEEREREGERGEKGKGGSEWRREMGKNSYR